jgi:DNA repair protein RecN (Recombination protein N)
VLSELTIHDLAIIDELHLRFGRGLNVLTGETGAGKSIIIDAVSLLLGGRADVGYIRGGADQSLVEGIFDLDAEDQAGIYPLLQEDGLEGDDPEFLLLSREIRRGGRNICRVNGRAVALKVLEEIGQRLIDIHGQTEHLSLMRVREHVDLLDRYGELLPLRGQVAGLVRKLRVVRRELADLRRDERDKARRMDLLRYQVGEIEAARLEPGEDQDLVRERNRLANAEQLMQSMEEAYQALYEGAENQAPAVDLVQTAARALAGVTRLDPSVAPLSEVADMLTYQLEDLAESLRTYRDQIEFNPGRLEQVEERLAIIHGLERKYGDRIEQVLAFADNARQELSAIEHSEERTTELQAEEERLLREVGRLGSDLSGLRREAGERLAAGIEAQLEELSMARARFGVDLGWRDGEDGAPVGGQRVAFDLTGLDRVEFLVAPNVGEPLKPLVRIASGGETSRLMLALKTVLTQADRTATLIFDEIDAGIGGRVGAVVGQKLWRLTVGDGGNARRHQVLCVTHLPQLACYADLHFHVRKGITGDRTVTEVLCLDDRAREEELAGMLGAVTDKTRASAREMLAASRDDKDAMLHAVGK